MTRLDRLLTLLDTGSTPATRKAAAVQIGEIQKCHPYDLHNLLNKVYTYLRSTSWDTRIAAGHAIDNIAANAALWDPAVVPPESADVTTTTDTTATIATTAGESTTTQTPAPASAAAGYLSFNTFDILKVLTNGTPLVASGGQEYDFMVEDMDPKELLAFQKKQVRQKLGLEAGGGDFMDMGDMIRDEDFIITPEQARQRKAAEEESKKKTQEVASLIGTEGMSARERAQAKRKQRLAASKGGSGKDHLRESQDNLSASTGGEPNAKRARGLKTVVTEQAQQDNKIVIESVVDQEKAYDSREWPFAPLCETLCDDLFNPNWETRHGAAIGLREVLRRHGPGAGKTADTKTIEEMENQNTAFLDDCAIRLLCVLALDRFGDFVSQMVAPVRESCAQALGTVIKFMRPSSVLLVLDNLLKLGERVQWEVRHVGLLGIKYLVGVRIDLVDQILPRVLNSIVVGLMDDDDDVRAVAADTLHPITAAIVKNSFASLPQILSTLWDILLDLDDLTASTPSVMNLLAEFYNQPALLESLLSPSFSSLPTHELIPRLWPFLRHSNPLVRTATLKMLERLVRFLTPVLADAMAHVYQTILIDDREDIRNAAHNVWDSILRTNEAAAIRVAAFNLYGNWLYLAGTPQGAPLEPTLMVLAQKSLSASISSSSSDIVTKPKGRGRGRGRGKKEAAETTPSGLQNNNTNNNSNNNNNNKQEEERQDGAVGGVRLRCSGSKAIGSLLRSWPPENATEVFVPLVELLVSPWASHQHTAALVLADAYYCEISPNPFPPLPDVIKEKLDFIVNAQVPPPYGEVDSLIITSLRGDAKVLSQSLLSMGLTIEDLQFFNEEESNLETCSLLATGIYETCLQRLQTKMTPQILDQLEARRKRLLVTIGYLQTYHGQLLISNQGASAGALVSAVSIPEKITPVVRSLMNSVKCEEDDILQKRAGHSLGHLVVQCTTRKMCPNNKILQNLIQGLVEDRSFTPLVTPASILGAAVNGIKKETKKKKENGDDATETTEPQAPEDPRLVLARRGSIIALRSIVSQFGDVLFENLPKIWDFMVQPMMTYYAQFQEVLSGDIVHVAGSEAQYQQLVDSLQILRSILPALHKSLLVRMEALFRPLILTVRHPAKAAQEMGGKTLASLCKVHTLKTMEAVIVDLLPLLGDTKSVNNRYGASLALHYIIEELGNDVLPYIVLIIIPILGCMSDQEIHVRKTVTGCFATLLKLMPLESGVPDPQGLSEHLIAQKAHERHFLDQLLDGTKVDKYPLPIKINAELRKYQQDGVNWLAFLNKYKLHGILCDDMGLGKTLQTICIIAGDDFYRRQNYALTPTANFQPLPSIVVCPPTLVGHWCAEITKFCDSSIKPLSYMGPPAERASLRRSFKDYTILVMSYDIVRNDIEHLQAMTFNYCVLDEGHVIKNAKTKVTQAVKLVRANHRLILSGTPIQNNVLELWSLFDFLMPGFLGSERVFNDIYSKPILASKDPKCSARDQELGTLAIEGLHRQVLPFLLRRLKEDVLADLPPKIIQDYHCDLSPLQVRLYESFGKTKKNIENELGDEEEGEDEDGKKKKAKAKGEKGGGGASHIFQALQYLRKLCCHPLLVLNPSHPEYEDVMKELKHSKASAHDLSNAPKLLALKELLHECGIGVSSGSALTNSSSAVSAPGIEAVASQHRVLIFAQMKAMLDIIESDLLKQYMPSVTYLRMDGSVDPAKRQSIVNQFNSDPTIDLLLLTTHVGGLGLNLTGADTVIFVEHDWNPMKDLQAMDRAHRLGQTKVVNVYRLIARGTLEEKIMGLQKFKLNIANTVINKENTSISTMSTDQLLDLFSYDTKKGKAAQSTTDSATDQIGNVGKKGGKLKSVLDSLEELWDESQYEEYNLENFLGQLNK